MINECLRWEKSRFQFGAEEKMENERWLPSRIDKNFTDSLRPCESALIRECACVCVCVRGAYVCWTVYSEQNLYG